MGWLVDPSAALSRAGPSRLKTRNWGKGSGKRGSGQAGGWRLDTSDVIPQKRTYRQTDRQTDRQNMKKLKMIGLS